MEKCARPSPTLWIAKANREVQTVRIQTVVRKLLGVTQLLVRDVRFDAEGLVLKVRPSWQKGR